MWKPHRKSLTVPDSLALAAAAVLLLLSQTGTPTVEPGSETMIGDLVALQCPASSGEEAAEDVACRMTEEAEGLLAGTELAVSSHGSGGSDSRGPGAALLYLTTPARANRTGGN